MVNIFTDSVWKEIEQLNEKVRETIMDKIEVYTHFLMEDLIRKCESPIEQMMEIDLDILKNSLDPYGVKVRIHQQKSIHIHDKNYRVDFLLEITTKRKSHLIVVECDGHQYHEKTKEQAKKDKSRDRALQSLGISVLRFTGSEIWNDSFQCAQEVFETIKSIIGVGSGGDGEGGERMDQTTPQDRE